MANIEHNIHFCAIKLAYKDTKMLNNSMFYRL